MIIDDDKNFHYNRLSINKTIRWTTEWPIMRHEKIYECII